MVVTVRSHFVISKREPSRERAMRSLFGSGLLLFSLLKSLFGNDSALPDPKLTPGDSVEGVAVEQQEATSGRRFPR